MVKVDASGRLQIPKDLMEKGGLVKEVVMTALTDRMQIWDKTLSEQENERFSEADLAKALSEKLGANDFID